MNSATPTLAYDLAAGWREVRRRARLAWTNLPSNWRDESARIVVGGVAAIALLAAFHQVVQTSVDRAAERHAAAHRHQSLTAWCSVERDAGQRALCLLTRPVVRGDLSLATVR